MRERREESLELIVVIIILRLISQSIFDNRENGLPYFTYVVAIISV